MIYCDHIESSDEVKGRKSVVFKVKRNWAETLLRRKHFWANRRVASKGNHSSSVLTYLTRKTSSDRENVNYSA